MTRGVRGIALSGCAALLIGAAPAPSASETDATPSARIAARSTTIHVTVTDLRSARGVVRACMTGNAKAFPKCRGVTDAHSAVVNAREGTVTLVFEGVKPGRYAIALLHDENGNNKADRTLGMMPREGFGFSRDAKVRMGPPRFDDAVFDVDSAPRRMAIHMRYML